MDVVLNNYKNVEGFPTFYQQVYGIIARRFIVFTREPRQWFMIIAPFLTVMTTIMNTYAYMNLFDINAPGDELDVIKKVVAYLLPFFMLLGFSSTSGIYMITPI